MNIDIHNPDLQARIQKQMETTGSNSVEEVLMRLLETQEEQDRWLHDNRSVIESKIQRGIQQLESGEGIPEERVGEYLKKLKHRME